MKDQSQMMNQSMNQKPSQGGRVLNQPPPQLMNMNPQTLMMNQPPPPQVVQGLAQPQQQQQMMNQRSYGMWPPPPMDMMNFPNPLQLQQQQNGFAVPKPPRNWKGKKGIDKRKDGRRKDKPMMVGGSSSSSNVGPPVAVGGGGVLGGVIGGGGGGGYQPPTLNELQHQNRVKTKRFYPKKKFNRFAPYAHAPRNTTSFIIRAKQSGGIASLVSPYPVTPAVLPTPIFSPSREALGDTAKEEWGVDGYGSMKGLIRLRSPGNEADGQDEDEEDEGGSSESDVEEHVEVERRLDHDLSRFEMIYPNYGVDYNNVLENRVDDQDSHIAQLEDENLILKERLFLMEREFDDLRRRLQYLERQNNVPSEFLEEVVENVSENESEGRDDAFYSREEQDHEEVMEENNEEGGESDSKEQHHENEGVKDVCMDESLPQDNHQSKKEDGNAHNQSNNEEVKDDCLDKGLDGLETSGIAKEQPQFAVEDQAEDKVETVSNGDADLPICQP